MELTNKYVENKGTIYLRDDPKSRSNKGGKPIIMFEGCEISRANSAWVQKAFKMVRLVNIEQSLFYIVLIQSIISMF